MLKELVRSVTRTEPKPARMYRYVVVRLIDGCEAALDFGYEIDMSDGSTMTVKFDDGHEGVVINGIALPPYVIFVDESPIMTEAGEFRIQLNRPSCHILRTKCS